MLLRLGRGGGVIGRAFRLRRLHAFLRIALRTVFVDALGYEGIAILRVLVAARRSLAALGVAALRRMLGGWCSHRPPVSTPSAQAACEQRENSKRRTKAGSKNVSSRSFSFHPFLYCPAAKDAAGSTG